MKPSINLIVMLLASTALAQSVVDSNLVVQTYAHGLDNPTGIAFLNDSGDALITQKADGRVLFVHNRKIVGTALDLPVANDSERGLLSIALSPSFATDHAVYLYHTAAKKDGATPTANVVDRWIWNGSKLTPNKTILSLPATPGPNHDGGKILFDAKGKLNVIIGDLNRHERTQNFEDSGSLTQTSSILRINPNGSAIATNPFANVAGAQDTFAYGIRNSFGIAVDPVTGNLWDTENGPDAFDEINLVSPGFNSGWHDIMGPKSRNGGTTGTLVSLNSRAHYSDPEFSWATPVAPTDLQFFNSGRLGEDYRNDLFIGDVKTGSIFHFDLSSDRKSLLLNGALSDGVADNSTSDFLAEQSGIVFGDGFGITSDLTVGPGGLFALSLSNGALYRITQAPQAQLSSVATTLLPEPSSSLIWMLSLATIFRGRYSSRTSTT